MGRSGRVFESPVLSVPNRGSLVSQTGGQREDGGLNDTLEPFHRIVVTRGRRSRLCWWSSLSPRVWSRYLG